MALGRIYTAIVEEAALSAATDIIKIVAPSTSVLLIHEVKVTIGAGTGDLMAIQCGTATGGGTTTGVTPALNQAGNTAFGGNAYDLTADTDCTETDIWDREERDVRAGYVWMPPRDQEYVISPSGIFHVRSDIAITSATATCKVVFEEIGT